MQIFHQSKYDLKGNPRSYMKIRMNANIMKTQFFHNILYDLKRQFYVMEKFCHFLLKNPLN